MKLMSSSTQPMPSMYKATEVFLEATKSNPLPDFVKRECMYVHYGGDGIKSYSVYDIEDGRVDEGVKALVSFVTNLHAIPGYRTEWEVVLPIEEALAVPGKKMP